MQQRKLWPCGYTQQSSSRLSLCLLIQPALLDGTHGGPLLPAALATGIIKAPASPISMPMRSRSQKQVPTDHFCHWAPHCLAPVTRKAVFADSEIQEDSMPGFQRQPVLASAQRLFSSAHKTIGVFQISQLA